MPTSRRPTRISMTVIALQIAVLTAACASDPDKPGGGGGGHVDNYACNIDSAGYCIFTGTAHNLDTTKTNEGFEQVKDKDGSAVKPMGKPIQDGFVLAATTAEVSDANELGYVKVFKVMAPIRDALMYTIASVDSARWATLTKSLTDNGIKTASKNLTSSNPMEVEYGTDDIYALARKPDGADIHHKVMKYLEEAELALKCKWLTIDLTNPEGVDPCK